MDYACEECEEEGVTIDCNILNLKLNFKSCEVNEKKGG